MNITLVDDTDGLCSLPPAIPSVNIHEIMQVFIHRLFRELNKEPLKGKDNEVFLQIVLASRTQRFEAPKR